MSKHKLDEYVAKPYRILGKLKNRHDERIFSNLYSALNLTGCLILVHLSTPR